MNSTRDSLTEGEAKRFLGLPDRSRTAILNNLTSLERHSILWSIIHARSEASDPPTASHPEVLAA